MSINYLVRPLDPEMLGYALECSVPAQEMTGNGRAATLDELKEAAASIPAHSFSIWEKGDEFQIQVKSEKTVLFPCEGKYANTVAPNVCIGPASYTSINGGIESTGSIKWMSFHGDIELLLTVVQKLTRTCGPQVMFADCDGIPWIINSPNAVPLGPEPWCAPLPEVEQNSEPE